MPVDLMAHGARGRPARAARFAVLLVLGLAISGCGDEPDASAETSATAQPAAPAAAASPAQASVARWYGPEQVRRGGALFAQHCAACHGDAAQGSATDWRQRDASGRFPPPPLDGTAHAWHHPVRALAHQIKFGAPGGKGLMPPFAEKLSDEQVLEVIAWFQDRWPDEIYAAWHDIEVSSRAQ